MRVSAMTNTEREEKPVVNKVIVRPSIMTGKVRTKFEQSFLNLYAGAAIQIKSATVFLEGSESVELKINIDFTVMTLTIAPGRNDITLPSIPTMKQDEKLQIFCDKEVTLWYSIIYVVK